MAAAPSDPAAYESPNHLVAVDLGALSAGEARVAYRGTLPGTIGFYASLAGWLGMIFFGLYQKGIIRQRLSFARA
jgi:hypothetical protein